MSGDRFDAKEYAVMMRAAALLIIEAAEILEGLTARGLSVSNVEAMELNLAGEHVGAAGALCEKATTSIRARLTSARSS